jgi:hypothetical protein
MSQAGVMGIAAGCLRYEMLTGKMAFHGEAVTDTLAAVIKEEPDRSQLPAATPIRVRVLLQRCLQKDMPPTERMVSPLFGLARRWQVFGEQRLRSRDWPLTFSGRSEPHKNFQKKRRGGPRGVPAIHVRSGRTTQGSVRSSLPSLATPRAVARCCCEWAQQLVKSLAYPGRL